MLRNTVALSVHAGKFHIVSIDIDRGNASAKLSQHDRRGADVASELQDVFSTHVVFLEQKTIKRPLVVDVSTNPATIRIQRQFHRERAKALIMPAETDLYFTPEDLEHEASLIPQARFEVIRSVWGHPFAVSPIECLG